VQAAIDDFNQALDLDNSIPGILDGLGQCYHAMKMHDEALENYNAALDKFMEKNNKKPNVEFLKNRSATYYDLKNYDESAADLDTALL
jgi:tetratricopeptide (TPR) repeat protein